MESRRMSASPDQRTPISPRASPHFDSSGLFGVRVQVQGIKGHPYVVLNNGGRDPRSSGGPEALGNPVEHQRHGPRPESRDAQRTTAPATLHYQRHPELLRPYDPDDNNLELLPPKQTASAPQAGRPDRDPRSNTSSPAGTGARIPLPVEGPGEDRSLEQDQTLTLTLTLNQTQTHTQNQSLTTTLKSPNPVDADLLTSVGRLIDRFNSPQRRGRCGPRGRMDPEERRRSRSADTGRPSDPSYLASSSSFPARGEGVPGSPRVRVWPSLAHRRGESRSTTTLPRGGQEAGLPAEGKVLYRLEKTSLSRSTSIKTAEEAGPERDTQVTPDLLKGWQELLPQPSEDTTKQILYTYLQDGTTDNSSTTQRKVGLVFDRINEVKWKTAENVEEEDKNFSAEVRALQQAGAALEEEVSDLRKRLEDETRKGRSLAEACEKAEGNRKVLQEQLEESQSELSTLRASLAQMEAELQSANQQLGQLRAERDKSRVEMKDLQHQLSEMHDELDRADKTRSERIDDEALLQDMAQLRQDFQEVLQAQEEQDEMLQWRERELTALKGALKDEVESHDRDMASLAEECDREIRQLRKALEEAKKVNGVLGREQAGVEEQRGEAQEQVRELLEERERLAGLVQDLNTKVDRLHRAIQEAQRQESQLEERSRTLEREKAEAEETLAEVREKEEQMCQTNHALAIHLENVQCDLTRLNQEHRELTERLKEESRRTDELRSERGGLEEERRLQDTTVEELQREMSSVVQQCEASTERLQAQVDEARERSGRDLALLQEQLEETAAELERSQQTASRLQEELSSLEEDLQRSRQGREEAQEAGRVLQRRVEELEESQALSQEERSRQVRLLEGRIGQLEEDLAEEHSSADLLLSRVEKNREQLEKSRGELLQERAARQDLECDKISLERQNKDLRSQVSHLEGTQRTSQDGLVSKLVLRIQELEDRLQGEERSNSSLQQANRKLERKLKELLLQVEDERLSLQTQKDQLSQRLKTAKRQMDEAEEEIERLENAKKKLQRDLDEQVESNDQLLSQVHTLSCDNRRKAKSGPFVMTMEDEADDVTDGSD